MKACPASGLDGWRMVELPLVLFEWLGELLEEIERTGRWPEALMDAVVVLAPKPWGSMGPHVSEANLGGLGRAPPLGQYTDDRGHRVAADMAPPRSAWVSEGSGVEVVRWSLAPGGGGMGYFSTCRKPSTQFRGRWCSGWRGSGGWRRGCSEE
eukprot:Sspe_Gene.71250::Locus_42202_Transcript_1_1_Confidence_1.000_Length_772::g.71250::m.71250